VLIEQFFNGLVAGAMYALITLGLTLVYGVMKILHVAHASVYTVGAYIGLSLYTATGSLLLALLGSMIFCAALGVCIEKFVYYPLLKFPAYVSLISSIAILIGVEETCRLVAGPEVRSFPAAIPFPALRLGTLTVSPVITMTFVVTVVILALLWFIMTRTELGLAMRAVSQDMEIASAMGVNTQRTVAITFVIGSAIAAVAGILTGIYYNQVYPMMGTVPAYKTLALIVVGGMGSSSGAVLASLLLGIAETLLIGFANIPLPRDALAFIAMIIILMWRPTGLMGKRGGK